MSTSRKRNKEHKKEYDKIYKSSNRDKINNVTKLWRDKNREKCKDYAKDRFKKQRENNPELYLFSRAKNRARLKSLDFNIEISDIIIPTYCPILGIELFFDGKQGPNTPTVDRINSMNGYVKGNVAVISNKANRLKDNGTMEEHLAIANWMSDMLSSKINVDKL